MKNANNVLNFYLLATTLKNKIRQGSIYWNVTAKRRESVAEHIYGTCILAIAIDSEYNFDINIQKVVEMLVIHELEEIIIGDITPFDNVTSEQKLEMGKKAVADILKDLKKKEDYIKLTDEFNEGKTKEAKFAYLCDKLEFDLQMKLYVDQGFIKKEDKLDTPVYNDSRIKKMFSEGLSSPAEIFYKYDVNKYNSSHEFKEILDHAYSVNLSDVLDNYLTKKEL